MKEIVMAEGIKERISRTVLELFAQNGYHNATIFNKIHQKMLMEVGRKATSFMLKYVKNNCKGGKIWIIQEGYIWIIFAGSQSAWL